MFISWNYEYSNVFNVQTFKNRFAEYDIVHIFHICSQNDRSGTTKLADDERLQEAMVACWQSKHCMSGEVLTVQWEYIAQEILDWVIEQSQTIIINYSSKL